MNPSETRNHDVPTNPALSLPAAIAVEKIRSTNSRVYISGPISGYADLNAPAFKLGEERLKSLGLVPVNPLTIIDPATLPRNITPQEEWRICMKADLREMYSCGAVLLLQGWQKSMGATWEYLNAKTLGIPVLDPTDMTFHVSTVAELVELFHNVSEKIIQADKDLTDNFFNKIR